jgi:hypothetical protein
VIGLLPWLALALAASPPPGGGSLAALVERSVEAYGGRAALERHPVVVQEGTVTSRMRGGASGRMTRILERPRRLRVSISYGGDSEQRVLDGARGWREGADVTGTPAHHAMVMQAARLDLPLALLRGVERLVDEGTVEREGRRLRAVTLPLGEGMTLTAEIDPETGRILRSVSRLAGPPRLEFATDYLDFREVSGVLVPFREVNVAQGQRTGETALARVEFLREAPTGAFRP